MHPTHAKFFQSRDGRRLEEILRKPEHIYAYAVLSRASEPAIGGAAPELDGALADIPANSRGFAKQACGALVGDIVVSQLGGRRAVSTAGKPRSGRVKSSKLISWGAIWEVPSDAGVRAASLSRGHFAMRRQPGRFKGQFPVDEKFFEPLPEDFLNGSPE